LGPAESSCLSLGPHHNYMHSFPTPPLLLSSCWHSSRVGTSPLRLLWQRDDCIPPVPRWKRSWVALKNTQVQGSTREELGLYPEVQTQNRSQSLCVFPCKNHGCFLVTQPIRTSYHSWHFYLFSYFSLGSVCFSFCWPLVPRAQPNVSKLSKTRATVLCDPSLYKMFSKEPK
jgi:hypothetical protein